MVVVVRMVEKREGIYEEFLKNKNMCSVGFEEVIGYGCFWVSHGY